MYATETLYKRNYVLGKYFQLIKNQFYLWEASKKKKRLQDGNLSFHAVPIFYYSGTSTHAAETFSKFHCSD